MRKTLKTGGLLAALLLTSTPALAHEIVRDGNVGALLHIEPDDAPLVGLPNKTWFETNQRGGKAITLINCACVLSVYQGAVKPGVNPISTPGLKTEKNKLAADLMFPQEGAYTLVLTGKPRPGATFNAFRLEWVVRAEKPGGYGAHQH
ncbi:hypothetical protein E5F05_10085 [Deinococcus metallilatus]|uniref:Copper resistance protein CopC n=1 Tax=Deinococcus metallilatus TaxID=1211322 RepID=A0AAJ5F1U0_9DEIO|nr:hypothetical protein [Deinococcus metallilatus]MBB5295907.1 hypothetical protein [Deinococcus metallilatus]QBY08259.1 hypothetical protein E5F05_10085 [Deinococcus metallilatus]RXJ11990.1 hypothetical protein ERJ73_08895 [Deinococcus metallilatus]TLK25778.1 hypothetical protein FCS05_12085 [Deinococcus metallilatus]GMA14559.1 hypothetical protein GCM10025871_08900 [Deinococcus metallilatus]